MGKKIATRQTTQAERLERLCVEVASAVGCPLGTADWCPEDCPGPGLCDEMENREDQRVQCWRAFCAGRNRIAEEAAPDAQA